MEYLRRIVNAMSYEPEGLLDDLKTTEAIVDYFELWSTYGTEFLSGIHECIEEGENPAPLVAFIAKHSLDWGVPIRG